MKTVAATELKAKLSALLGDVERGEVIHVTRHGRTIARIVPESAEDEAESRRRAVEGLNAWRKTLPKTGMTVEDILSARDEGRR